MGLRSVELRLFGNQTEMAAEETECIKEDSQMSGGATG